MESGHRAEILREHFAVPGFERLHEVIHCFVSSSGWPALTINSSRILRNNSKKRFWTHQSEVSRHRLRHPGIGADESAASEGPKSGGTDSRAVPVHGELRVPTTLVRSGTDLVKPRRLIT